MVSLQSLLFFITFIIYAKCNNLSDTNITIGFHTAIFDDNGNLLPWLSWEDAVELEMNWYLNCPIEDYGYPVFVYNTFMNGYYEWDGFVIIPGMQDGMGIISYVKYFEYTGRTNHQVLEWAKLMASYILNQTLTPNEGPYANFPRSSGLNMAFPLDVSAQADVLFGPDTIEPDKGGIVGYALLLLYNATQDSAYLDAAVSIAKILTANMIKGDENNAPFPFRVNSKTGAGFQSKNGNMVYILRLFNTLADMGIPTMDQYGDQLWNWILNYQIPSPVNATESLWVGFFEDQIDLDEVDRNSWCPLETARYLIERKDRLDPDWMQHAEQLIVFALDLFSASRTGNVTVMGEQDFDHKPWGGANSKLGGVASMYACAGGPSYYKQMGINNLNWMTYFIDNDGCPTDKSDGVSTQDNRGGWQEDAHTDVIHNFVDAMNALNGKC